MTLRETCTPVTRLRRLVTKLNGSMAVLTTCSSSLGKGSRPSASRVSAATSCWVSANTQATSTLAASWGSSTVSTSLQRSLRVLVLERASESRFTAWPVSPVSEVPIAVSTDWAKKPK